MTNALVSDSDVEKALDYLRDTARQYAEAKADRIFAEEYRKTLKAILMRETEGPIGAQEREAYAHPKYVAHLESLRKAVIEEETYRARRAAAEMKIETWRSWSANTRGKL